MMPNPIRLTRAARSVGLVAAMLAPARLLAQEDGNCAAELAMLAQEPVRSESAGPELLLCVSDSRLAVGQQVTLFVGLWNRSATSLLVRAGFLQTVDLTFEVVGPEGPLEQQGYDWESFGWTEDADVLLPPGGVVGRTVRLDCEHPYPLPRDSAEQGTSPGYCRERFDLQTPGHYEIRATYTTACYGPYCKGLWMGSLESQTVEVSVE